MDRIRNDAGRCRRGRVRRVATRVRRRSKEAHHAACREFRRRPDVEARAAQPFGGPPVAGAQHRVAADRLVELAVAVDAGAEGQGCTVGVVREARCDEALQVLEPGRVHAERHHVAVRKGGGRRIRYRRDVHHGARRAEHRAQRQAHGDLLRLVEALVAPADLVEGGFAESRCECRQGVVQDLAGNHEAGVPAVADDVGADGAACVGRIVGLQQPDATIFKAAR